MKGICFLLVFVLGALTAQAVKYKQTSMALEAIEGRLDAVEKKCKGAVSGVSRLQKYLDFKEIGGYVYLYGADAKNWQDARAYCQSLGGDLAAKGIRDTQTYAKLYQLGLDKKHNYWIGLTDMATEGSFVFVDGVAASNSDHYWLAGEPNNNGGNEDCAHLWTDSNKQVNDSPCSGSMRPLCEFTM